MMPNFKFKLTGWMGYLLILVLVSLLLGGVRSTVTDTLIIYAENDKSDFIQVFFPVEDVYSEANSVRSAVFVNSPGGLEIPLPSTSFHHLRIDPANEAGNVIIKKMELKSLFKVETYLPSDLLSLGKPTQMIDKFELAPAGLLIHSTGNDPVFELQLDRPSVLFRYIMLGIVSILLSLAVFVGVRKMRRLKSSVKSYTYFLFAIPFLISAGISALFYPGFMSYDTLHALRSARNGVTDSMWPPMVSYVWRAVDLVSFNPSAMHFSQVFLLLFSIFFVVFFFTKKISYAAAFLLVYLSVPVVLGTVAVIWKDVLMAAFFMAGFAVIVFMRLVINKWGFIFLSLLAAFLIFLGVCSRHNAITGAVPLIFYLAMVVCSRVLKTPFHLWLGVILLGSALTGAVFVTKIQLDNYSLLSLVKMNSSNDAFIQSVRVLDVAGASLCVGSNLFADVAPNLSLAEIRSGYDPRHINLSKGLLDKVTVDSRINKVWLSTAVQHPICFLNNKFQLTKYLIGADKGIQFLITAPSVDNNEYGYSLPESSLRDSAVAYIVNSSQLPFLKPWFLYLISFGAFIYLIRIRSLTSDYVAIFLSAVFYFGGLVLFGNAADARLPFYTTTALLMFTFISISEFKKRRK